ncbi:MAG: hypothetical protein HZB43_10085 [candidate division Zixibacteria bacterium]|nr:hypothetical protein [candidate division Zixibacteria bacterium]
MLRPGHGIKVAIRGTLIAVLAFCGVAPAGAATALQRAERLVIHYHSGSFELVSRMTIRKVLPGSVVFADTTIQHSGSWFELQSATGTNLYRRMMQPPQTIYVEALEDSTSGRYVRQEATVPDRTFVLLVPLRDDAVQVAFYGPPVAAAGKRAGAQLLGSISLR